jgi:hypothetical protein
MDWMVFYFLNLPWIEIYFFFFAFSAFLFFALYSYPPAQQTRANPSRPNKILLYPCADLRNAPCRQRGHRLPAAAFLFFSAAGGVHRNPRGGGDWQEAPPPELPGMNATFKVIDKTASWGFYSPRRADGGASYDPKDLGFFFATRPSHRRRRREPPNFIFFPRRGFTPHGERTAVLLTTQKTWALQHGRVIVVVVNSLSS